MNEISRKKISRTALRKHCKKLETKIDDILERFDHTRLVELSGLKMNYEKEMSRIEVTDQEIQSLITDEAQLEAELDNSSLERENFYQVLAKVEHRICEVKVKVETRVSPNASPTRERSYGEPKVKLPKIELKKFDGSVLNWQTFWDQFESTVHNQPGLSDVDKFTYLKGLLSSSASECISGLTLTNGNYAEAVKLLRERFGNTQLLINAYMESFVKLPKIKSMNQITDLRIMYDQLETTVRNLRTLNVATETYGSFLVPLLTQKLPSDLTIIMSRQFKSELWELKDMLVMFKEELEAKERCAVSVDNTSRRDNVASFSTMNLHQQQGNVRANRRSKQCMYCKNDGHAPSQCPNVTDVESRVAILREGARCFVCLQPGHVSRFCRKEYQCRKCTKRHHISICKEVPTDVRRTTTTFNSNSEKEVQLQTGRAYVYNVDDEGCSSFSRIMFDGGSQRSYVTEKLMTKLKLTVVKGL